MPSGKALHLPSSFPSPLSPKNSHSASPVTPSFLPLRGLCPGGQPLSFFPPLPPLPATIKGPGTLRPFLGAQAPWFLGGRPSRWLLLSRGLPVTSAPRLWWGGSDRPCAGGPRGMDPILSPPSNRAELLSSTCPPLSPSGPHSYQVIPFSCP